MTSIKAASNVLTFRPKSGSYFYETFPCQQASSNGYNSVQFSVKGPASGSFTLEIQTKSACSAGIYSSQYYTVSGLTGSTQTITVPLSSFSGANANAVNGFVWSGFSSTTVDWQLSNIAFGCGGSTTPASSTRASSAAPASSTRVSSAAPSSVRASSSVAPSSVRASSSAAPSPTGKTSTDGSCGGTKGFTCVGFSEGECCSQYGWCGNTAAYCGTGCNPLFGKCTSSGSSSSSSVRPSSAGVSSSVRSSSAVTSSVRSSSSSVVATRSSSIVTSTSPSASAGSCSPLLIDDWISQSRLTFMFYNAFNYPTSTDDSVTSITVGKPSANRVEIVPKSGGSSYFYSQFPCVNAKNKYGGISLRIKAPRGATLSVELDSNDNCDPTAPVAVTQSSTELGWTFDGTEKLYLIPFSKFAGINQEKLVTILFSGFSSTVSFGPMAFYCGSTGEYIVPTAPTDPDSTATVPAPSSTATPFVIDNFANANTNSLGNWHGGDDGMTLAYSGNKLTITSNDADYSFYTQLSGTCRDFNSHKNSYLHLVYTGTTAFTIALQQHNSGCNSEIAPFPETWDSIEVARYAKNGHIYVPLNHFNINFSRVIGFALKGFHSTQSVTISQMEIVSSVPAGTIIPKKAETGNLIFACKRPNSFAFAIDDGIPDLAQDVLKIIREENIKVTFFTVGAPLLDQSTNLTNVYKEMRAAGHQLALHSFTHPKMESLPDYAAIDWEYNEDIKAMKSQFDGLTTPYFRPPFGNEGARMRSRLANSVGSKATIVNWSVDVEDWLWATTNTPEKQLEAFQRDVTKGGNLVVLHYLYPSTVSYLRQFIQIAKATGKDLMRVDQCMEDPEAPAYVKPASS